MALPEVTARTFSRYCGKSEGYYGSISSQNLDISTNSLLYLSEVLEYRNSLHPSQRITELQAMIANEVAKRIQRVDTQNVTIRKLVLKAIARTYLEGEDKYSVPPIVIAWGVADENKWTSNNQTQDTWTASHVSS